MKTCTCPNCIGSPNVGSQSHSLRERAETLADDIIVRSRQEALGALDFKETVSKDLLRFAEEAVRDATIELFEGDDSIVARIEQGSYARGWDEALEEAAKVTDSSGNPIFGIYPGHITSRIRDLKGTK